MKKEIFFRPMSEYANSLEGVPLPATGHIPKWYKDQKLFSNGENEWLKAKNKNPEKGYAGTYKLCVPITDSVTAGYILSTSSDILVENAFKDGRYSPRFTWKTSNKLIDNPDGLEHKSLGNYPIPTGYVDIFTRWMIDWQIVTPPGYSLWVTHPSHRFDLPFFTINGFVDTDKHPASLKLPFFLKQGFEGIIPSGTPIAQIIPVKRDNWVSKKIDYTEKYEMISYNLIAEKMIRSYKTKFWSRKSYK